MKTKTVRANELNPGDIIVRGWYWSCVQVKSLIIYPNGYVVIQEEGDFPPKRWDSNHEFEVMVNG